LHRLYSEACLCITLCGRQIKKWNLICLYRLFSLANIERAEITESSFQRREDFSLQRFAERSFGVFQEEPFDVVWRFSPKAAADARQFLFHCAFR
jgi:WYL domain